MIVAILAVMLVGIASFTVDFGQAYVSKRQLQTATDAGVLAAGAYYTDKEGTCAELSANTTYTNAAQDIANNIVDQNLGLDPSAPATPDRPLSVTCNSNGQLVVGMTATRATPVTLGAIYGVKSITTGRSSEATVAPAASAQVKPYALCSSQAQGPPVSGEVFQVGDPGQAGGGSDCPDSETGGNWWWLDCPEDTAHSGTPDIIAENLKNGCSDPITIIPDQPTPTPPAAAVPPTDLSAALTAHCSTAGDRSSDCVTGDTGNSSLKNKKVYDEWPALLGKKILLPVFCGAPTCDPDTVNGTGTHTVYPVYKVAAMVLCGYHIYDKASGYSGSDECNNTVDDPDTNPSGFDATSAAGQGGDDSKKVWLYVRYTHVYVSNDKQFTDAGLGTDQDGGARQVTLTK
ncbi:MAG TPA: pilus assembly protein TadG-related protein [Nocardioidaceae bacterium]|nr:pilus assembly protein TadG-related protein [Nocardioidaceae bacterium]